jgi:hypothetical protein
MVAAVCLLLASKMNEIHVPSIKFILNNLDIQANKKQFIIVEQ